MCNVNNVKDGLLNRVASDPELSTEKAAKIILPPVFIPKPTIPKSHGNIKTHGFSGLTSIDGVGGMLLPAFNFDLKNQISACTLDVENNDNDEEGERRKKRRYTNLRNEGRMSRNNRLSKGNHTRNSRQHNSSRNVSNSNNGRSSRSRNSKSGRNSKNQHTRSSKSGHLRNSNISIGRNSTRSIGRSSNLGRSSNISVGRNSNLSTGRPSNLSIQSHDEPVPSTNGVLTRLSKASKMRLSVNQSVNYERSRKNKVRNRFITTMIAALFIITLSPFIVLNHELDPNFSKVYWTLWTVATLFLILILVINSREISLIFRKLANEDCLRLRLGDGDDDGRGGGGRDSRMRGGRVVKTKRSRIHATHRDRAGR